VFFTIYVSHFNVCHIGQPLKVPAAKEEKNFFYLASRLDSGADLGLELGYCTVPEGAILSPGSRSLENALFAVFTEGAVAEKHFETIDKPRFQRHSCTGPDFWSEKGKNAIFSLKIP
jgi:hypothetical protein